MSSSAGALCSYCNLSHFAGLRAPGLQTFPQRSAVLVIRVSNLTLFFFSFASSSWLVVAYLGDRMCVFSSHHMPPLFAWCICYLQSDLRTNFCLLIHSFSGRQLNKPSFHVILSVHFLIANKSFQVLLL